MYGTNMIKADAGPTKMLLWQSFSICYFAAITINTENESRILNDFFLEEQEEKKE